MIKQTRRKFSPEFKSKVVLETIRNQKTLSELSLQYEVNAVTISKWKAEFLENMPMVFGKTAPSASEDSSPELEKLYAQIGQLKVENDFLKKSAVKLGYNPKEWKR